MIEKIHLITFIRIGWRRGVGLRQVGPGVSLWLVIPGVGRLEKVLAGYTMCWQARPCVCRLDKVLAG